MSGATCDADDQDAEETPQDDSPRCSGGLMEAPLPTNLAGHHINENLIPLEGAPVVRRVTEATIQLRRWIVVGLGILIGLIFLIGPLIILIRPELDNYARTYLQVTLTGLLSMSGTVVGFLFARGKDR